MAFNLALIFNAVKRSFCSSFILKPQAFFDLPRHFIHSSPCRRDLMEFFDEKENWSKSEVRVGRSWRIDELRIKSNEDLHKLWYVLLKERNMLLTMEHEYLSRTELFPSAERLDKVKESMLNLEEAVRERNRAYNELEIGESGERPASLEKNRFGLDFWYKHTEHTVPMEENPSCPDGVRYLRYSRKETANFLMYFREKIHLEKRKQRNRDRNHVMGLLRRYPHLDIQMLKDLYPSVDVERVRHWKKARGHFVADDVTPNSNTSGVN